jgi:AcrR family transcriptional regulator
MTAQIRSAASATRTCVSALSSSGVVAVAVGLLPMRARNGATVSEPNPGRRPYRSAVRQEQAARTRERIITAAAELLHGFPIWNWRAVTVPAVAERAGVNERTVYRHFATEKDLRDAVLARLGDEADVHLEQLTLEQFDEIAARVLQYVSQFPLQPRSPVDATVAAGKHRQRDALLTAVTNAAPSWTEADRNIAAAMFDVVWSVVSYEQLISEWGLEPEAAIAGVTWVIRLVRDAIRADNRPGSAHRP